MEREPLSTNVDVIVLSSQAWFLSGYFTKRVSHYRLWTMDKARKLFSAK